MIAPACRHEDTKRHGRDRHGNQRLRCKLCGKTWVESRPKLLGDMRIPIDRAVFCLRLLLEGNSIRSVERLTDTHRDTIMRLVVLIGERCQSFLEKTVHKVPVDDVQVDEIWGFIGCKKKTADRLGRGEEFGDAYCYTAIERTSRLLLTSHLGKRTGANTRQFAKKLKDATVGRFQLSSDGFRPYREAMPQWLGDRIDFAQLFKIFQTVKGNAAAVRYSPGNIIGIEKLVITGTPRDDRVCTSHAERHNLTIRTQVRRMTRLTNAFSKKWENHEAALGLFFAYYNFCRVHGTLKTTPAVAAGLADSTWSVKELLEAMAATHS